MVLEFLAQVGVFALAAAFAVGPVRAFAVDRYGAQAARAIWVPALATMIVVSLLLPVVYTLGDLGRSTMDRRTFELVYTTGFLIFYLGWGVVPALVARSKAVEEEGVAAAAAYVGTMVFLVMIYPVVNFVNSCFLGHGILLPAGCN
jgi:uncharacterized membrane protein